MSEPESRPSDALTAARYDIAALVRTEAAAMQLHEPSRVTYHEGRSDAFADALAAIDRYATAKRTPSEPRGRGAVPGGAGMRSTRQRPIDSSPIADAVFNPDWVIHPGETLREWREENHLPASAAAMACARMPVALYRGIEAGTAPIDEDVAAALAHGTRVPATLWLNLERTFRAGLEAGKT
jgi:plasmid maintenance system antidote protein VapI